MTTPIICAMCRTLFVRPDHTLARLCGHCVAQPERTYADALRLRDRACKASQGATLAVSEACRAQMLHTSRVLTELLALQETRI